MAVFCANYGKMKKLAAGIEKARGVVYNFTVRLETFSTKVLHIGDRKTEEIFLGLVECRLICGFVGACTVRVRRLGEYFVLRLATISQPGGEK